MTPVISTLIYIAICAGIAYIGRDKKFGYWGNFFVSFLFSPIIGVLCYFAQSEKSEAAAS